MNGYRVDHLGGELGSITVEHITYGCVRCQRQHFNCEAIYGEHLYFQSKHGTRLASEREHQLHHGYEKSTTGEQRG